MARPVIYSLSITCPFCKTEAKRTSTGPFIYLDADGLQAHSSHTPECPGEFPDAPVAYAVVREPDVYRQFEGDPQPPESEGGA